MAPPFEQRCTSSTSSDAVRAASAALLQMAACFHAPYKFTFKHRFLCLICPELLHSYHNCNVDSFFATDEQFQYGMNVDFNRLTNAHFRQQVKMAASLSRTFHTSNIVIVAVILIIIVI